MRFLQLQRILLASGPNLFIHFVVKSNRINVALMRKASMRKVWSMHVCQKWWRWKNYMCDRCDEKFSDRLKKIPVIARQNNIWWNGEQCWGATCICHWKWCRLLFRKIFYWFLSMFFWKFAIEFRGSGLQRQIYNAVWTNGAVSSSVDRCYNSFRRQRQINNWFKRTVIGN